MFEVIDAIKRKFIDQYGFPENPNQPGCVQGDVPDGTYPMTIKGKSIKVEIKEGMIHILNANEPGSFTKPLLKI